jgi:hypothetical protein
MYVCVCYAQTITLEANKYCSSSFQARRVICNMHGISHFVLQHHAPVRRRRRGGQRHSDRLLEYRCTVTLDARRLHVARWTSQELHGNPHCENERLLCKARPCRTSLHKSIFTNPRPKREIHPPVLLPSSKPNKTSIRPILVELRDSHLPC